MVRHNVIYDDSKGLLFAVLTSSGVIAVLFTYGLVTFHRLVCEMSDVYSVQGRNVFRGK